jgi:hypothetical protein
MPKKRSKHDDSVSATKSDKLKQTKQEALNRLKQKFSRNLPKINKPKLKLKTSRHLLELADEFYKKHEELRKFKNDWVKHSDNPESKEYTKALDAINKNKPALLKELEAISIELNKEKFQAATGKDLDSVERKAKGYGDKNSWLTLLRWEIEYLFDEQLIATICKAHKDRSINDIRFLAKVAHIIATPLKTLGKVDKSLFKNYSAGMTNEKLIQKIYNETDIHISDKYLRRHGIKKR